MLLHPESMAASPHNPATNRPPIYTSYLEDTPSVQSVTVNREPDETTMSNDSGISHENDQDEGRHTSPQPNLREPQPEGPKPNQEQPSHATIGVLSRPVEEVPDGLHHAAIGLFAQPLLGNPRSPPNVPRALPQDQNMSPPTSYSPQQYSPVAQSMRRTGHQSPPKKAPPASDFIPQPQDAATNPTLKGFGIQHQLYGSSLLPSPTSQPRWYLDPIGPSCSGLQSQQRTSSPFIAPTNEDSGESCSPPPSDLGPLHYDPLRGLHMTLEKRGMMDTWPHFSTPSANGERPIQCPLCQFSTPLRSDFNKHLLAEHSDKKTCPHCSYIPEDNFSFKEHLRTVHGVQSDEELFEDEVEATNVSPKVNAQGRTKVHRCKNCDFSSPNQHDYWRHIRIHMNPEKILECPKCPFPTELKHHLEYHLCNHVGKKPFKCDQCDYTCVNKSMLNSHKKSHSNVYQYHCADCSYISKYCHSLKTHLRKYRHNPGRVLNPDGTVNPLPVIDVYGTRRGPRRHRTTEQNSPPSPTHESSSPLQQQPVFPLLPPMFGSQHPQIPPLGFEFAYNSLMNLHRNQTMQYFNPPITSPEPNLQPKIELQVQIKDLNMNVDSLYGCQTDKGPNDRYTMEESVPTANENSLFSIGEAPLDLSRYEPPRQENHTPNNVNMHTYPVLSGPSGIKRSKRKGKAVKIERIVQRLHGSSSDESDGPKHTKTGTKLNQPKKLSNFSPTTTSPQSENNSSTGSGNVTPFESPQNITFSESTPTGAQPSNISVSAERNDQAASNKGYRCPYCGITFETVVLYTVHMGYHGFVDPFTCNSCGVKTRDSLEFNIHLNRQAHN